ncbi:MAG: carboxypeptidase-like regulatory domain-containing protein [Verrucomicrobiae bacterium]
MKTNKLIWFGFIMISLIIGALFFWHSSNSSSQQASKSKAINNSTSITASPPNQPVVSSNVPVAVAEAIHSNTATFAAAYEQGKISKAQAIQEMLMEENKKPLDFFGKVIDQYGKPVVGAKIKGTVLLNVNYVRSADEVHYTETDAKGNFSFVGLHGVQIGAWPEKVGYKMGERGAGFQAPIGGKSSPDNQAILTMWKIRGPEPMKCISFESRIPSDGTSSAFDTVTGKQSSNGDLQITLLRSPLEVRRSGQKFDWSVKVEILHGGIAAENDPYPYWAPESGYQPFFQFDMSSNNVPWDSTTTQNFYIKNVQGQYGRMQVKPYASATPAGIKIDLWLNPSGSQNLEFDPTKQIH